MQYHLKILIKRVLRLPLNLCEQHCKDSGYHFCTFRVPEDSVRYDSIWRQFKAKYLQRN